MEKRLGKIESVSFGLGGYQGAMLGLHVTLGDGSWGVGVTKANWDAEQIMKLRCWIMLPIMGMF